MKKILNYVFIVLIIAALWCLWAENIASSLNQKAIEEKLNKTIVIINSNDLALVGMIEDLRAGIIKLEAKPISRRKGTK